MNQSFYFNIVDNIQYPKEPFHPPKSFTEFVDFHKEYDAQNKIFTIIRQLFLDAGYDSKNRNKDNWNPFRGYVKNNQLVLIKPNLVYEETGTLINSNCITTHASVIRPIIDYLFLLQKQDNIRFKIIIGDVPLQSADWNKIIKQNGFYDLIKYYKSNYEYVIDLLDLRREVAIKDANGFIVNKIIINGDPNGYRKIHLQKSFLDDIINDYKKFSVGDYNSESTSKMHSTTGEHYYHIPQTVLKADLFINVPKIKTHQKAGITIALKNLIGINGDKSWIPHYRKGAAKFGGDEFSNDKMFWKYLNSTLRRILQGKNKVLWDFFKNVNRKIIKKIVLRKRLSSTKVNSDKILKNSPNLIMDGAWYGNNTLWRSILDLNYLLFHSDKKGQIKNSIQKKYIAIGDGIVSGEGNGPLVPLAKKTGLITLADNPVIHDICCSALMGFDWKLIPQLKNTPLLNNTFKFNGDTKNINISGYINNTHKIYKFSDLPNLSFKPAPGWYGHIEKNSL